MDAKKKFLNMEGVRSVQARMSNSALKIRNDTPKDFECTVQNHCKLGYQMKLIFSAYIYLGNWPRPQTRRNQSIINQQLIIFTTNPLMESAHVDKTLREHLRVTIQIKTVPNIKRKYTG